MLHARKRPEHSSLTTAARRQTAPPHHTHNFCCPRQWSHGEMPFLKPAHLLFRSYNEVFVQTAFIPCYLSTDIDFVCVLCTSSSTAAVASLSLPLSLSVFVQGCLTQQYRHFSTYPFIFSQLQRSVCTNGIHSLLPLWHVLFFDL